jgi:hypothetical protein
MGREAASPRKTLRTLFSLARSGSQTDVTTGSSRWSVIAARGDVEIPRGKLQLELSDPLKDASSNRSRLFRVKR